MFKERRLAISLVIITLFILGFAFMSTRKANNPEANTSPQETSTTQPSVDNSSEQKNQFDKLTYCVIPEEITGKQIQLKGTVFAAADSTTRLANADLKAELLLKVDDAEQSTVLSRSIKADAEGNYDISATIPGSYTDQSGSLKVTVSTDGYRSTIAEVIALPQTTAGNAGADEPSCTKVSFEDAENTKVATINFYLVKE